MTDTEQPGGGTHPGFWFCICFLAFFLVGCVQASYGPLLPVFRELNVPLNVLGALVGLHAVGAMVGITLAGRLVLGFPPGTVLLGFCMPLLAGLILLAVFLDPWLLQGGAFLTGVGFGGFDVGLQLVAMRFLGARPASSMNLLLAGFGVGAFAAPFIVSSISNSPMVVYGMLAVLLLVLFLVFTGLPDENVPLEKQTRRRFHWVAGSLPFLLLFFAYNLLEYGIATWSGLYLATQSGSVQAAGIIAAFWGAFLGARLLFPVVSNLFGPICVIAALAVLAVVLLGMLALPGVSAYLVFFVLLGLCLGPVFPTGIAWIGQRFGPQAARVVPTALLLSHLAGFAVAPVASTVISLWGEDQLLIMNIGFALCNLLAVGWVAGIMRATLQAAVQTSPEHEGGAG